MQILSFALKLILPLSITFGVVGYIFEVSYFYALDLSATDVLGLQHFVASGASLTLPAAFFLVFTSQLKKFFTKAIHEDDVTVMLDGLSATTFAEQIVFARMSFVISVLYGAAVALSAKFNLHWHLGSTLLLLVFFNLQNFFAVIQLSPKHSRFTVIFMFLVAVFICFAAGGYSVGLDDREKTEVVREDFILKIERTGTARKATAKELPVEIPLIAQFFKKLAWNSGTAP